MSSSSAKSLRVAIIGGGITGLTAAYQCTKLGHKVRLLERSSRFGGSVGTEKKDGWLIEAGPNSLLEGEPELRDLVTDLGLGDRLLVGGAVAKNRFIVRDGKLVALPMSPPAIISSPIFSAGTKIRIFAELLKAPRKRPVDVSLETLVRDHFGQECVDYGLNPFVSGVYAGDPAALSAQHAFPKLWEIEREKGSIIRGMIAQAKARKASGAPKPRIVSFRNGLQELVDTLVSKLPEGAASLNSTVRRLTRQGDTWEIVWADNQGAQSLVVDRVLLAVPAGALAKLEIGSEGNLPFSSFTEIPHPVVSSLFLGFKREQVKHPLNGFGVLIPGIESRKLLGVLFSSSLFEGRAPEGHVALTVMAGGMRNPGIGRLSQEELLSTARRDLQELLGVEGEPVFQRFHNWPAAIPQYNLGHERFLEIFKRVEAENPGLLIGGNSRDGIALSSCVASGLRLAKATVST